MRVDEGESAGRFHLSFSQAAPDGVVLAEGQVVLVAPHPDAADRLLVVMAVDAWTEPILFR